MVWGVVFSIFQILLLITERVHSFVLLWDVNNFFYVELVWCGFNVVLRMVHVYFIFYF